jgi:hypothetical protein
MGGYANPRYTVFMSSVDLLNAKNFISGATLFQSGVDSKRKNATTLWLSQKIFNELKGRGKIKCDLDGIQGVLTYKGTEKIAVEINKTADLSFH